jgi:hypothetical protein
MEWEKIWSDNVKGGVVNGGDYNSSHTFIWRHRVPTGWIVRSDVDIDGRTIFNDCYRNPLSKKSNLIFVPDPNHEWDPMAPSRIAKLREWCCEVRDKCRHSMLDRTLEVDMSVVYNLNEVDLKAFIDNAKKRLLEAKRNPLQYDFQMVCGLMDDLIDRCPV